MYSPIAFPQKTDKQGDFVREYVPELAKYPAKYIYEPWKAPVADQKKAGCLVKGGDWRRTSDGEGGVAVYPKPMFDFAERRRVCLDGMKEAYAVKLMGDNEKVLDGSWRELFAEGGIGEGLVGGEEGEGEDGGKDEDGGEAAEGGEGTGKKAGGGKKGDGKGREEGKGKKRGQGTLDGVVTTGRKKVKS